MVWAEVFNNLESRGSRDNIMGYCQSSLLSFVRIPSSILIMDPFTRSISPDPWFHNPYYLGFNFDNLALNTGCKIKKI